ncbi:MAG: Trp biosynthesis-associated membrane protein, partial [Pseudonocardiaceae bacterium]
LAARSEPGGPATLLVAGPLIALAGALALAAAGTWLAAWGHRMPRLGARYRAPAAAREQAPDPGRRLWDSLDAGEDPTDPR